MLDAIHQTFADLVANHVFPEMFSYGFLINALLASLMIKKP